MLLVFFTWPRSATASHSVAACQQNVNRSVVIKKKKKREMEMWRAAIPSQITSVFPCRCDGEGEEEEEESKKKAKGK